jgi:hypothetical protein
MSCLIENGYELGCVGVGGVKKVYLGTYNSLTKYTLDSDNVISAVLNNNPVVYNFSQEIETAGLMQTNNFSAENLTVFQSTVLNIKMYHWTKELRNTYAALTKAPIIAVVESMEGEFYVCGVESPGRVTEGGIGVGTAMADLNGSTISITWKSVNGAYLMDSALLGDPVNGFTLGNVIS